MDQKKGGAGATSAPRRVGLKPGTSRRAKRNGREVGRIDSSLDCSGVPVFRSASEGKRDGCLDGAEIFIVYSTSPYVRKNTVECLANKHQLTST